MKQNTNNGSLEHLLYDYGTHTFPLLCGVECEVSPIRGADTDKLFHQKFAEKNENLGRFLASVIVRVGSITNIYYKITPLEKMRLDQTGERYFDVEKLLDKDTAKIILEARRFTYGFEPTCALKIDYEGFEGDRHIKTKGDVNFALDEIKQAPYTTWSEDDKGKKVLAPLQCVEYDEALALLRNLPLAVEHAGHTLNFVYDMPTLRHQSDVASALHGDVVLSDIPRMYNVRFVETDGAYKTVNFKNLNERIASKIREGVRTHEGVCNLICEFENPFFSSEHKEGKGNMRVITQNLLQVQGFLTTLGV